jgi:ABC-type sugar transport system substrate-binding protein
MCAQSMVDTFGENPVNMVIIEGAAGSFPAIHRTSGFQTAIEGKTNYTILGQQNCGWDRPTAQATMEDFITRYGDKLNAVYSHDDNMAIGVIQALKAAGILEQVKVFSISGTIEGVDAIKAGEMVSTVDQSPTWEGEAAVEYAVKYLNGEQLPKWIKTPIASITADNAAQFSPAW